MIHNNLAFEKAGNPLLTRGRLTSFTTSNPDQPHNILQRHPAHKKHVICCATRNNHGPSLLHPSSINHHQMQGTQSQTLHRIAAVVHSRHFNTTATSRISQSSSTTNNITLLSNRGRTALVESHLLERCVQRSERQTLQRLPQGHPPVQQFLESKISIAMYNLSNKSRKPAMASVWTGCDANKSAAARAITPSPSNPRSNTRKHR